MRKKIEVIQANIENNELLLTTNDQLDLSKFKAVGQLLVDSDHVAFVYLVEEINDYTYIVLPTSIWPELKSALDHTMPVKLMSGSQEFTLDGIHEELIFLIENIKGNSNYGKEMIEFIERTF